MKTAMKKSEAPQSGVRERKSQETRSRIAHEGIRLFESQGYDATTLETVALASDISPRTLYHYFESKYDILLFFHDGGLNVEIGPTILEMPRDMSPFEMARDCLLTLVPKHETDVMAATYRIWNSTEALKAQKLLSFKHIEQALYEALCQVWPGKKEQARLKSAAMVAAGALRLAMDEGVERQVNGNRTLKKRLADNFRAVDKLFQKEKT